LKAKEIIEIMNKWAPPSLVDHWDNTGFQIGDDNKEVDKILLALDLDYNVYKWAKLHDFKMIITHHPAIFAPMKSITTNSYKEGLIYNLIKDGIVVFNVHTNLDRAEGGLNDYLAKILGLKNLQVLEIDKMGEEVDHGYGRVGDIEEVSLSEYLQFIKGRLETDYLIVYGETEKTVKRVAVCGGSGAEFITHAHRSNASIYVTGDIKYHDAQEGAELGITVVDAGHYHTEKIILPVIKEHLEKNLREKLHIEIWDKPSPPYKIY